MSSIVSRTLLFSVYFFFWCRCSSRALFGPQTACRYRTTLCFCFTVFLKKQDATRRASFLRLFPSDDYHRFALQLSAEGYAVPPSLLIRSFSQIDLAISALKAGLPIQPIQASVRRVLPSMLAGTECPSPLSDLPTMVSTQKSIGAVGTAINDASSDRALNAQHSQGKLLPLWLIRAPTPLFLILLFVLCALIAGGFLFSQRLRRVFGRRSRLKRRSWAADLQVTHQQGDDVEDLTVSCVDIFNWRYEICPKPSRQPASRRQPD